MKVARGFTLLEVLATISVAMVLAAILAVLLFAARDRPRRQFAGAQISGVTMAFVNWSADNRDRFPAPSLIDASNTTVADAGAAKNTTSNIYSLLIWNMNLTPEMLVAGNDPSPNIKACAGYAFTNPPAAIVPARALWDPAFNADFTLPTGGNTSIAHQRPLDWVNANARTPLTSNRGPEMAMLADAGTRRPVASFVNHRSLHLRDGRWEGRVGYADGHIEFRQETFDPVDDGPPDEYFIDESPNGPDANTYLSIFTNAGGTRPDFKAIWD